jgi:hypothetical protein
MRFFRAALLCGFAFASCFTLAQQTSPSIAQQPVASSTQGTVALQQALKALAPATSITDITLTGTARRIAGSDDESGTVTVKALAGTGSIINLALASGSRAETRNISTQPFVGSWSGPDGVSHAISDHNLFTDPGWFPAFTVASLLSAPNAVVTYVGPETHDGQSVIHISGSQQFPSVSNKTASLMQHLTQTDIYLDATTFLPAAITFNTHPDNNALLDIPIEMRFSDYQTVHGAQLPFNVQKFINNTLSLDLQFTNAVLNSGLSASSLSL